MENTGIIHAPIPNKQWYFEGITGAEKKIVNSDRDWREFCPPGEMQRKPFETMACVSFSANNALEALAYKTHLIPHQICNRADRFLAKASGTSVKGNTFFNVGETVKSVGVPNEESWKYETGMSWVEFYAEISNNAIAEANEWRDKFRPQYELVFPSPSPEGMASVLDRALQFGPVQVCNDYHAFLVTKIKNESIAHTFDTYDPFHRECSISSLRAAVLYSLRLPETSYTPPMVLPNNALVFDVGTGKTALHLNGYLLVDEQAKINFVWTMRNSINGIFDSGPTVNLQPVEFDAFRHKTLSDRPLNY